MGWAGALAQGEVGLCFPRESRSGRGSCVPGGARRVKGEASSLSPASAWGPVMEPHWAPPAPGGAQSHSFRPLRGLRLDAACVLLSAHRLVPLALGLALPKGLNFPPSWAASASLEASHSGPHHQGDRGAGAGGQGVGMSDQGPPEHSRNPWGEHVCWLHADLQPR